MTTSIDTPRNRGNDAPTSNGWPSTLLVVGLLVVFVAQRIMPDGNTATLVTWIGAAAVLAALGWKAFTWARAQGDVKRVEGWLLASYGAALGGLVLFAAQSDWGLAKLGLDPATSPHAPGVLAMAYVVLLLVSVCATLFLEASYRRMPIAASLETRRLATSLQTGLTLGFAIVFLAGANYVAQERDVKRDLSYFKTSRPSQATFSLVRRLGAPLRVTLFYSDTSEVLAQLRPYFQELGAASRNVKVAIRDHALVPEIARKHRVPKNGWILLVKGEGDGEQAERIEVGDELEEARSRLRNFDDRFQQAFTKLTQPPRAMSLTAGHGEHSSEGDEGDAPEDRTTGVNAIFRRYNVTTSRLGVAQGLATGVPENTRAVAILGPRQRFLPEEAASLLAFVKRGGRLMVMVDPNIDTGLAPLLDGVGLELRQGILSSATKYLPRTRTTADHAIVHSNGYSAHPIVGTLSRHANEAATIFINGGAIARKRDASTSLELAFPVHTTPEYWLDLDGDHERDENEPLESMNMVAAVGVPVAGREEGRIVVIADGDFVTDKVLENPGNLVLFIDALRWLIGEEQVQTDLTSEEDVKIEHTRDQDKVWFYATSFALPLPLVGIAIWIGRRRRARAEGSR